MPDRATSIDAKIIDEAARWVSEMEGYSLCPDQQQQFDKWLAAHEDHARAYSEMQDVWRHLGAVPESPALRANVPRARQRSVGRPRIPVPFREPFQRAPRRWASAAVTACLALVIVGAAQDWPTRLRADALTETGETRLVNLSDGSRVQLGTNSAIAYDLTDERRSITLLKGEAVFTVAPDRARPFEIEAAGGTTTALGTQFLVRRDGDQARVVVTEHTVRVALTTPGRLVPSLSEGQAVRYGPEGFGPVTAVNAADAIAWTDGALVFKDASLPHVISEIARYRKGYLRVTGDARALRVSGVFHITDPDAAIEQLRRSFDLQVTSYGGWLTTISN